MEQSIKSVIKNASIEEARGIIAKNYATQVASVKSVTLTQLIRTLLRFGTLPTKGGELSPWAPRPTQDGTAYFNKDQQFPARLITDPGALEQYISNGLTGRENLSSTPFSSFTGTFSTTINRSAIMDLLIGKIGFRFSNSTLKNTTGIRVEVIVDIVQPTAAAIALASVTSYFEGSVVTANGSPILDFTPWLQTWDSAGPAGTGAAVLLQDYIARPFLLPCTDTLTPPAVLAARPLQVNEVNKITLNVTSSDPNLQTDILLSTGTSSRMVDFRKALSAARVNETIGAVFANG